MIKRKLKSWVIPALSIFIVTGCILCYYLISNLMNYSVTNGPEYVTETLMEEDMPVNKEVESQTSIKPYNNEHVQISKNFYSKNDDESKQQKSLIKYENIYMPNTGILYSSDTEFEILAVLDGKVTNIKEDNILGNIIEIEHNNGIISIYQSVKDIYVQVGDKVKQGNIIAKSGPNKLTNEKENCLHFEVYKDGSLRNPEEFYNVDISSMK